jgi:lysophospholipase L1-like esterase
MMLRSLVATPLRLVLCGSIMLMSLMAGFLWREALEPAHIERYLRTVAGDQTRAGPGYSVLIGDSITVAAPLLPVCGRAVVKAAFNGAQVQHALDYIMPPLRQVPPGSVLIAVGVNNAWRHVTTPRPQRLAEFEASYRRLIDDVLALTPRVGLVLLPSVAKEGPLGASFFDQPLINEYNQIVSGLAAEKRLPTFPLSELDGPDGLSRAGLTRDGVHLTAAGYAIWMQAVTKAWRQVKPCPER